MKIYFSAAIAQKDLYQEHYETIVRVLKKDGHKVYEDTTFTSFDEAVNKTEQQRIKYYNQVLTWMAKADMIVVEASFPSTLHIGHEITLALENNKPVVVLYHEGQEPSFFLGLKNNFVQWVEYTADYLPEVVKDAVSLAEQQTGSRFNFYLSAKHGRYLDTIAKKYKIPRAAYLRKLLDDDMIEQAKLAKNSEKADKK